MEPTSSSNSAADAFGALFSDLKQFSSAEAKINQEQWAFTNLCTAHARQKFSGLQGQAADSLKAVEDNKRLISHLPLDFGTQLDELERHLANMESVVRNLDDYSAALERRYLSI